MRNIYLIAFFTLVSVFSAQAQYKNDLSLIVAPIKFEEQSSYQLLYKKQLKNDNWKVRGGLRLFVDTDRETRLDTVFNNEGSIQYDISLGLQRQLKLDGLETIRGYLALDGYWNSDLKQTASSDYYGYFWDFGMRPTFGISYDPLKNIRLSLESRANFNINLQDYNAPGGNADQRITFNPVDHLALGLGYLF